MSLKMNLITRLKQGGPHQIGWERGQEDNGVGNETPIIHMLSLGTPSQSARRLSYQLSPSETILPSLICQLLMFRVLHSL